MPESIDVRAGADAVQLLVDSSKAAVSQLMTLHPEDAGPELGLKDVLAQWESNEVFDAHMVRLKDSLTGQQAFTELSRQDASQCVSLVVPLIAWTAESVPLLRLLASEVAAGNDRHLRSWDDPQQAAVALKRVAAAWEWALAPSA